MQKEHFVIATTLDQINYEYLAIDQSSGGYPYWTPNLSSAQLFNSTSDPRFQRELAELLHGKNAVMSDGTTYPNTMKHSALGLNNNKLSGVGKVMIMRIEQVIVETYDIEGEISKSQKNLTEEELRKQAQKLGYGLVNIRQTR